MSLHKEEGETFRGQATPSTHGSAERCFQATLLYPDALPSGAILPGSEQTRFQAAPFPPDLSRGASKGRGSTLTRADALPFVLEKTVLCTLISLSMNGGLQFGAIENNDALMRT